MACLCFPSPSPLPRFPSLSPRVSITKIFPSSISLFGPSRFRSHGVDLRSQATAATLTVDYRTPGEETLDTGPPRILLEVRDLTAIVAESRQEILRGVNLIINEGEVHAIMGKNGS
ncbi:hypothetical protein KSP39_PZI009622 [Platanthera zijinensis]|uniref:Uncharacterized protein n=1 Tax=Platanthera zijinensis TaxID=2320716 RepID=A0AAP0G888_9ASPA